VGEHRRKTPTASASTGVGAKEETWSGKKKESGRTFQHATVAQTRGARWKGIHFELGKDIKKKNFQATEGGTRGGLQRCFAYRSIHGKRLFGGSLIVQLTINPQGKEENHVKKAGGNHRRLQKAPQRDGLSEGGTQRNGRRRRREEPTGQCGKRNFHLTCDLGRRREEAAKSPVGNHLF